ncbi:MAG: hypothetical protein ACI9WC_003620 [Arenicella sp.]|jgi:hypothetical protein
MRSIRSINYCILYAIQDILFIHTVCAIFYIVFKGATNEHQKSYS